jgi:prepilin-type N-terminal cleavage/methylation domain-containing protein
MRGHDFHFSGMEFATINAVNFISVKKSSGKAGMTLVEVMVALALLGIGLAGGYYAISAAMQARRFAHDHYIAALIANNQVERAKNLPFVQLILLSENNFRVDDLGQASQDGRYYRSTTITTPWNANTNLAQVSVSVRVPHPRLQASDGGTTTVATLLRRMD